MFFHTNTYNSNHAIQYHWQMKHNLKFKTCPLRERKQINTIYVLHYDFEIVYFVDNLKSLLIIILKINYMEIINVDKLIFVIDYITKKENNLFEFK